MALLVAPDIEQVVADYLRSHPEIRAVVRSVVSRTPADTRAPWVRYTQISSWPRSGPAHYFRAHLLQFDCYAGRGNSREEASLIARTIAAALADMSGTHGNASNGPAVVTAVTAIGDHRRPDPDVGDPARERYIVEATVYAHAVA